MPRIRARRPRTRIGAVVSLLLAATSAPVAANAQDAHAAHAPGGSGAPRLGSVVFPNAGAPAAQPAFLRGVALLHSFEFDDAASAFRAAERTDPGFALAYWLEALTYSHVQWGEDDPATARRALARLAPTAAARLAKARTRREREYGAAVEAYYRDTTLSGRLLAFADSMRAIAARYPADPEPAAFASLALLNVLAPMPATPLASEQRRAMEDEAVTLAERVFHANPRHPGAAHYLIHVSDADAAFATRALPAARAYAEIAPDAEHALHMPSHVFLKLGLWDDVATSNERAWAASRAWMKSHRLDGASASFHTLAWLQYAYLQQGRWRAARALLDTARALLAGANLSDVTVVDPRYAPSMLAFAYAAETGRWTEVHVDGPTEAPAGPSTAASREAGFLAASRYARAVAAAMRGDSTGVGATLRTFGGVPAPGDAGARRPLGALYALTLEALATRVPVATAAGATTAIAGLRTAAGYEDRVPLVGPPPYLSAYELLGDALLRAGDMAGAADAYTHALAHQPNRSLALLGLARARRAAGDAAGAADAYRRLLANWSHADPDVPALAEVRAGAGAH